MADLAEVYDVEQAWRPLTPQETTRARYLIGRASRMVLRRWPETWDRIALGATDPTAPGALDAREVADVVVAMVLTVLAGPPVPGARSWQVTSGQESRSVTLASAAAEEMTFAAWMVELFDGCPASGSRPAGHFPPGEGWPDPTRVYHPPPVAHL